MTRRTVLATIPALLAAPASAARLPYTIAGSRTERNLKRALHAVIEGKVKWFRGTHFEITLHVGLFAWNGQWLVITSDEFWNYDCDDLAWFKVHMRSRMGGKRLDIRALIYLEIVDAMEEWIAEQRDEAK